MKSIQNSTNPVLYILNHSNHFLFNLDLSIRKGRLTKARKGAWGHEINNKEILVALREICHVRKLQSKAIDKALQSVWL